MLETRKDPEGRTAARRFTSDLPIHRRTNPAQCSRPNRKRRELPLASEPVEVGRARTPGGEFPVHSAKIESKVELGQYRLDVTEIRFSDINPIPGAPTGNIGYQILRGFTITLDSKNRRIRFDR